MDTYIGATQIINLPGKDYGGVHVIENLISGRRIHLKATGLSTGCYVRKSIDTHVTIDDPNEAYLYNLRNLYQNYGVATNTSHRTLHTYISKLLPNRRTPPIAPQGNSSCS